MQSVRGSLSVSVGVMVRTQGSSGLSKEKKNRISTEKQKRTEKQQTKNRKSTEKVQKNKKQQKNKRKTTEKSTENAQKKYRKIPPLPLLWNAQHLGTILQSRNNFRV